MIGRYRNSMLKPSPNRWTLQLHKDGDFKRCTFIYSFNCTENFAVILKASYLRLRRITFFIGGAKKLIQLCVAGSI